MFRKKFENILECIKADPNTYEYATLHLVNKSIDLATFFLERGGSLALTSKHLRKNKKGRDGSS